VWWHRLSELNTALLESANFSAHTHTVKEMSAWLARNDCAEPVVSATTRVGAPLGTEPAGAPTRFGQLADVTGSGEHRTRLFSLHVQPVSQYVVSFFLFGMCSIAQHCAGPLF
jgi:hypothetical protein